MRYRLTKFDAPAATWRATRDEVFADAIALGLASWDGERGEWFVPVPGGLQSDDGDPPALTRDMERLAEANMIRKHHREGAAAFIAGRVKARAEVDDDAGVHRWLEIAGALYLLNAPTPQ